jgi:acetylglutamate synthase
MFTHVHESLMDPNKAFVSLSHRPSDSYLHNVIGFTCRYYHHSSDVASNVNGVIRQAINEKGQLGTGQMKVIDY